MPLFGDAHQSELRDSGWHSRGYLFHFDGRAMPQFITFHLADSIPLKVIQRWREELKSLKYEQERIVLQRRIFCSRFALIAGGTPAVPVIRFASLNGISFAFPPRESN